MFNRNEEREMKLIAKPKYYSVVALVLLVLLSVSCDRVGTFPLITFKTDTGYTSESGSFPAGTKIKMGILAAKDQRKNVLKTFDISETINNGTTHTIYNIKIPEAKEDQFDYDLEKVLDTAGTVVKYVFTVANRDGLNTSVNITLTSK
jgi:hypothetical protein